jgi:AraC-like DNA-binding protein
VSQAGREVMLQAGEAVLKSVDAVVTTMKASRVLSFRLPRARLEPLVADLELVVVQQVYDLITLTLGAHRDAREVAAGRGVRAARLRAIKEEIADRLDDPSLSITTVAQWQGVSPRYVCMLFDDSGTTYSSYVLEQRLERARRLQADPHQAHPTIGAMAAACGFADVPYFNRSFRRAFGLTPSDIRAYLRPIDVALPE